MIWFILIIVSLIFFLHKKSKQNNQFETKSNQLEKIQNITEYRDYEFYNHFKTYHGSYDYISPSEASKRVKRMQNSGRQWDNEKYHDLQNRAFSKRDAERIRDVEILNGEDLRIYFDRIFNDPNDYITAIIMERIHEKLSKHDEPLLLQAIGQIPPKHIKSWIFSKKQEGFFFTEKVYEVAWVVYKYK